MIDESTGLLHKNTSRRRELRETLGKSKITRDCTSSFSLSLSLSSLTFVLLWLKVRELWVVEFDNIHPKRAVVWWLLLDGMGVVCLFV